MEKISEIKQQEKFEFSGYMLIAPIIMSIISFSIFSEIDRSHELAKQSVLNLSEKSEAHDYIVTHYFKCRDADIKRGECVSQSTFLTESAYGTEAATNSSIDLKEYLIAADDIVENYEVYYSAIQFRAWRSKYFDEE